MTGSPDVTVDGGQGSSLMRYTCASSNASMTELPLTASAERLQRLVDEEQQEELKLRCTTSRAADGEYTAWGCLIRRERFGFLLVLALAAVNQANGASSVLNYSTTLLMSSLFEVPVELAVTLSLLLLSTKLLGVIASLLLAGRCGRRMLVLAGALLTAGCLALAAGACAYGSLAGVLVGLFGFVLSYGLTLAPTLHLLLAELFSPTARPLGACLATALSFSAGAVVDLSLLSLVDALGWSIVLGLLGCVCLLGGLPVLLLPETCGRTLSEIQSLLAARRTSGSCHPCGGAEEGERTARLASPLYDAQGQDLTKRASSALALSL
jgi:MFS family permease